MTLSLCMGMDGNRQVLGSPSAPPMGLKKLEFIGLMAGGSEPLPSYRVSKVSGQASGVCIGVEETTSRGFSGTDVTVEIPTVCS